MLPRSNAEAILRQKLIAERDRRRQEASRYDWRKVARATQIEPAGDWSTWAFIAGRGAGKTRAGAEWVREQVKLGCRRIALVARTSFEARTVMVEGESGLLAICHPKDRPIYTPSKREVKWSNGAIATTYSADEPDLLRGPQHDAAWADELAAWSYPSAWDMLLFGLRLGNNPRVMVTTTPRGTPLVRRVMSDPDTVITRDTSYANRSNLDPKFFKRIAAYEGTDIGRQEIHAELMDVSALAILKRNWWKVWRGKVTPQYPFGDGKLPECEKVLLSFDTAFKPGEENDFSAMTAWGVFQLEEYGSNNVILLDAWQDRLPFPDLKAKVLELYKYHTFKGIPPDWTVIEDKGSGISLLQELRAAGIDAMPFNPGREDKAERAHAVSDLLRSGCIWVPGARDPITKLRGEYPASAVALDQAGDPVEGHVSAEAVITHCENYQPTLQRKYDSQTTKGEGTEFDPHDDLMDTCTQAWRVLRDEGILESTADVHYEEPEPIVRRGPIYG